MTTRLLRILILSLLALGLIIIATIYIMIPATLTVATIRTVGTSMTGSVRYLNQDPIWKTRLTCSGSPFSISRRLPTALQLVNHSPLVPNPTELLLIQVHPDSVRMKWETEYNAGWNPLTRFTNYQKAVEFKKCTRSVLDEIRDYLENNENLYGFRISRTTLTDTFLLSTRFQSKEYPSVDQLYSRIDSIKSIIRSSGAIETNYPMINVRKSDNGSFSVMIGIPTNKQLRDHGSFTVKRMAQYKNRTLVTEARGGTDVVEKAINAMMKYMDDYRVTNPTTYFAVLVTDRRIEKDPSKWVTRIYYPIV